MIKSIVCCSEMADPNWAWIAPELQEVEFHFIVCVPKNWIERRNFINFARLRGSLEAVRFCKRIDADMLVAHGPALTAWCALFGRLLMMRATIVSYAFNFAATPNNIKTWVFSKALQTVDRFFVFSTVEKSLYSRLFSISEGRFKFIHWGVHAPAIDSAPCEEREYVSAIGGNARDYFTLVEAARRLPHIPFILVVRPHSLIDVDLPENMTTRINISFSESMNILYRSRFMVLPLINSEIPCGHVTIVAAMHLSKAMVITSSSGVADYVKDNDNAITIPPSDVDSMASGIDRLWNDRELCKRLGGNGKRLAAKFCSESSVAHHFRAYLASLQSR